MLRLLKTYCTSKKGHSLMACQEAATSMRRTVWSEATMHTSTWASPFPGCPCISIRLLSSCFVLFLLCCLFGHQLEGNADAIGKVLVHIRIEKSCILPYITQCLFKIQCLLWLWLSLTPKCLNEAGFVWGRHLFHVLIWLVCNWWPVRGSLNVRLEWNNGLY